MKVFKYLLVFVLGFLVAKFWHEKKERHHKKEEVSVFLEGIQKMSKLVVSQGSFSEVFSFSDSKKYFYDYLSFQKKAILSVNAKVEVGYDLSKLEIQIDSLDKSIIINKIPKEELVISPEIKYFDLQQSKFNSFSNKELNKLSDKAIEKIRTTVTVSELQKEAKNRLFEELSKIYQLSRLYGWKVVNNTDRELILPHEIQQ